MLEIEGEALALLSSARADINGSNDAVADEETLLRVIALRLVEQAISIWQDTTGEPISLQTVAALIPSVPVHFSGSPKPVSRL